MMRPPQVVCSGGAVFVVVSEYCVRNYRQPNFSKIANTLIKSLTEYDRREAVFSRNSQSIKVVLLCVCELLWAG